jgi:hypothetical protein
MTQPRFCMSYADLLNWTNSNGETARIQLLALPKDTAIMDRYALVISGAEAAAIVNMITDALDVYFTKAIAAQLQVTESHGPGSSTEKPD